MIEQKEIKKLIQSGFDLELISFELDIPIEQLRQYKKDLESSNESNGIRTTYSAKNIIDKRNNEAHSKMEKMRERYRRLFFSNNTATIEQPKQLSKPLSQEDVKLIETVIETVEKTIQDMKNLSRNEKRQLGTEIIRELKKIEGYQLSMEQSEKLYMLISSEELQVLDVSKKDKKASFMTKARKRIATQFAKNIELMRYEVDDIEQLRTLQRKISIDMEKENPILIGQVKSGISKKILALQQQKAIDRIRNDIPTNIASVITDLVNGNIDMQKANAIIDEEVRKRVESKPKTKFSLTEEQERNKIWIQIRTAIIEKADKYHIQDPETMILQIYELSGGELGEAVRVVVENLILSKDFKTAKSICDKFSIKGNDKESIIEKIIRSLRNKIINAELSDIILTVLNTQLTIEEERAYIELIEKALRTQNVKLESVSLGKSKDGSRNITLADIWKDQKQKAK